MKKMNRLEMDSIIGGKSIRKRIGALKRKTVPFLVTTLLVTTALCYGGPQSDCPPCIVGYWNMDESSGALVDDSYGGNHGEVLTDGDGDDPVWMTGKAGNALCFAGDADDMVAIGDDPAYHFGTGDFALEAWIKYEGPTDGSVMYPAIMSKRPGSPGSDPSEGFGLYLSYWPGGTQGALLIRIEDTNYHQSTIPVDDGEWHHVVVQRCQDQVQFYVDGLLNVTTTSNKNATTDADLLLGLDPKSSFDTEWKGLIDEVALYDCCLSPETINCHYEYGTNATQIEVMAGENDNFDPDPDNPPASPSPALVEYCESNAVPVVGFDSSTIDTHFIHTFQWDCETITKAWLEVRINVLGGQPETDSFTLWFSEDDYEGISYEIWDENDSTGQTMTIVLDLGELPASGTLITNTSGSMYPTVNLLPTLNETGYLDLKIQDDTSVDYAKLTLCCECEQPCQGTSCGIINEVATNPANWTSNWTGTTITPETTITFQGCNGDLYTLYGYPGLEADNDPTATLQNYEECQYAKYCWIEEDNKKIIQKWVTMPSNDSNCQNCCEYCCNIDFTFNGSPVGGGSTGGGPPRGCPGQILTYEYRLTNGSPYGVNCVFSNTSPVGNVAFDPSSFSVDHNETQIIYIHYQMPGNYGDTCGQQSYTFSHVLNVTVITDQGDVLCTPIEKSVHIDCWECPQIGCCDGISNLFSGEHMQMENASGDWVPINTISWDTWNIPFGNLDDQLYFNCGAEWVYGIGEWKTPSRSEEHYKLDFTIPQGECYEIAFSACVDDAAIFRLEAPNGVITEFFDTTEFPNSTGTYSNFYACFEKGDNGEMEYCLPPGDYTLHIDHWNTEGPSYGLIFAATKCNPCRCPYEPSRPCIDITKKVVDPTTGQLVDNIEVPVGTEVDFEITVCNCGTSDLKDIKVVDYFFDCLEYLDSEASVTIDDISISGNQVVWEFSSLTLHPGDCIKLQVRAMEGSEGDCKNCVMVYAESKGGSISDKDCVPVIVIGKEAADTASEGSKESGGQCLGSALLIGILALGAIALNRKKN